MLIAKNKKAFHDYEILESLEAGIVLTGPEVKSLREKKVNLKGSFVSVWQGQVYAENVHISPYKFSPDAATYNPIRKRKLLLHGKEITAIGTKLNEKGITAIPLEIYFKQSLVKISVGLCRGRKLHDKRALLKKKDQNMEIARALKR